MYVLVHPNGSKYFRLKYYFNGKEKHIALGVYPEMSLLDAKNKVLELRRQINENIDPAQQKKIDKLTNKVSSENNFEAVAREWHKNVKERWSERYAHYVLRRLEADIFPKIGFRDIAEIKPVELISVLREVQDRGALDIAKRLKQTCGQVFEYAVSLAKCERNIVLDIGKDVLKSAKKENYKHLPESELPEFMNKLENYDGEYQTKLGLRLLILTMVRTKELRFMEWCDLDFKKKLWTIPPNKMKKGRKHLVPLSKQAMEILEELKSLNSGFRYVFPNRNKPKNCISENTLLYAMYRLGYHGKATVHGFRGTASTILNERGFKPEHIEVQLAHIDRNAVRASYNHALYLEQRTHMIQWWADFIDGKVSNADNIINANFG